MAVLILLFMIFIMTVIIIWIFPPDIMEGDENCEARIGDLWGVVRIFQTSNFGKPSLTLKPDTTSTEMFMHFPDRNRAVLALLLPASVQKESKEEYEKLLSDYDLQIFEETNLLRVQFDRNDENLGYLITKIYREAFQVNNTDRVKFAAKIVKSDLHTLQHFKNKNFKIHANNNLKAVSARFKGQSAFAVQTSRIFNAVSWLLFPPLVVLSYKFFGLNVMYWSVCIFLGFFAAYATTHKRKRLSSSWGNIVYCALLLTTIFTQNVDFLQSIPSVIGILMIIISGTLGIGLLEPKSESDILQKQNKPQEFVLFKSFMILGGICMILINEWARRNLNFDSWIWFFGFFRLEITIIMVSLFAPAYTIFFLQKNKTLNEEAE